MTDKTIKVDFADSITNLANLTKAMLEAFDAIEERLASIDARLAKLERANGPAQAARKASRGR